MNSVISDINQFDGADSSDDSFYSDSSNCTDYSSDDEAFSEPVAANLYRVPGQNNRPGQPILLDVNQNKDLTSSLPLCLLFNARSVFNKCDNLTEMLKQISPDICILSESWESQRRRLNTLLNKTQFKSHSYYRKNRSPGGGCAIIFNESRFSVSSLEVDVPEEVESVWALMTPKSDDRKNLKVKRIAVGSFYISPKSRHKAETIEHIIQTIHTLRARYDNDIHFLCGGDFNRVDISDILDSYGALKQLISVSTRHSATLEILLSDLHTLFHPPTTLPPLQVDEGKVGKDSDHNVVVFAPKSNIQYHRTQFKKIVFTRPLPESGIFKFERDLIQYPWDEVFMDKCADEQAEIFHNFLRGKLDQHFPQKRVKISALDKKWMNPSLKHLHRRMKREFFKNRKSPKYKLLKAKFKKMKRKSVKSFYTTYVSDLKTTNPGKWFSMAKKIGALDQMGSGDIQVESLLDLDNKQCAEKIAQHFSAISNEYSPIDLSQLPCYLPALPVPQVEEYDVYLRIKRLNKTKSTLPIDIPAKLRDECAPNLAGPLRTIINTSLEQSVYPALWKHEWVTPAPKISNPQTISDLRKISCTSDSSKVFEGFLKDWIMEDVSENIDIGQFGGQAGMGTEHMIVCYLDRILQLLDRYPDKSAVIATSLDWAAAFDRQDPTIAIQKFIKLGIRPSLIPLLVSYLSDRKMQVKFNGEISRLYSLIGGGPQGTLIGGIEYTAQSNDNADIVPPQDRFKYIDDLSVLQLVLLSGLLVEYNFVEHVASDVGVDQMFLPASSYKCQDTINYISNWTKDNKMKLNEAKCSYMVFTRTKTDFATRLTVNNKYLERVNVTKILGIWVSEDLSWNTNCKEICKRAYSRLSMITKLKYAGVSIEDLLEIYILFVRSIAEYCSVAFHSSLTVENAAKLEQIQKTCLKVILGEMYVGYTAALEMCGLKPLSVRRTDRCLQFAKKCLKHPKTKRLFPLKNNQEVPQYEIRNREEFEVNFAGTDTYRISAIPFCQRLLNEHYQSK